MKTSTLTFLSPLFLLGMMASSWADIARTPDGHPQLSGTYDVSTLTPLQRPEEFGNNLELTPEEAQKIMEAEKAAMAEANRNRGPIEEAPPEGGAPPVGTDESQREALGAGNVGGYNFFWTDRGTEAALVNGKFRTSILVDPPNGRMPAPTPEGMAKFAERRKLFRPNDGTAWWVDLEGPGPYDGPESLGISERCIVGFTGATPTFPSLYNNYKRIVQSKDHVMILVEMVHDARIVRLNSEHKPDHIRSHLGDSIGWWEGDTLVVDTTNFLEESGQARGSGAALHVVERFTPQENGDLLYRFTVNDPETWSAPWTGEYTWRQSDSKVYEYACHEGNYSMAGILKGARLLESEQQASSGGQ
ncbi:MAG: hypothetical protein RIC89_10105 [Pseudomonadales bacterium]